MTYVTANLHGCLEEFHQLLEKINFRDSDYLYIVGDVVDHGEGSIELIEDISMRYNVYCVVGEHDLMALKMLSGFEKMLSEGGTPDAEFISEMTAWVADGGQVTLDAFRAIDDERKEGVLDYLSDMALYEEVTANGKKYLLVHAGIKNFTPDTDLELLPPEAFLEETLDFTHKYYDDMTVITGHTPTAEDGEMASIFYGNGSIDVDCGLMRGGRLGCLCLENGKEYYV